MAAAATQLPHLVSLDRVMGLPVIELALTKSAETYSRVKNFHRLMYGAFTTVEMSLNTATKLAMPIAMPIVTRLENQIHFVDDKLCRGLDKIEEKVPLVKEKPEQIVQDTSMLIVKTVTPAIMGVLHINHIIVEQTEILQDVTWKKTNQILDTYYGNTAVKGIVSTSILIDNLLDEYFPPIDEEETTDIKTAEEDKLLCVLQTIGCLTTKASKRIYSYVVHHFSVVKKDYLVPYINRLIEFLCLTRSLHEANEKCIEKRKSEEENDLRNGEKKTN
ncbi:lipid storage droplets surface-binding protein 2 [Harpegnathos saltator]|uniref:Lipid storage droplets surface-binding protein 2 n=1 Tax=Harpegnathos saltator TaxID=610380 RepID=E2BDR7_HARSA|nr:lipid storage droplets surface-binding protein 2 [Harpegnathos saltator]EFN86123.1 Lipid storage droplets surface-binding protein 2 [Harpegnathos saltator]